MNYQAIYNRLVSVSADEGEVHHIKPRCMGGTDEKSNLVKLSYKAHFLAHHLLCKIHPHNIKLKFAFAMMTRTSMSNKRIVTPRMYEIAKKENSRALSILHSTRVRSLQEREAISRALTGRKRTPEQCRAMSISRRGRPLLKLRGRKRPGVGGRQKGFKGVFRGTPKSIKKMALTKKRNFAPSFNTKGYQILTPTGWLDFDGVKYSGLIPCITFRLECGRSITVSKTHCFDSSRLAREYQVGDDLLVNDGSRSRIIEIHDAGKCPTYDILEVPNHHQYYANTIVNHNCQFIVDRELQIIPEWNHEFIVTTTPDEYRKYYHQYVAMDLGVKDFTAALFGYYDFRRAKMIITDELTMAGSDMTTILLKDAIIEKERANFGSLPVYRRIADNNNLLLLQDLGSLHNMHFTPTNKDSLDAMVNELRMFVGSGRLQVDPKCAMLIGCLKYGIWDGKHKEFGRSTAYRHFDHLAALVYLIRNLDQATNPIPDTHFYNVHAHHINEPTGQRHELDKIFGIRCKR